MYELSLSLPSCLRKIDNKDLIKKAEDVRDSFLKFLKENKGTDFVSEDVLKEREMNMSNHERLLRSFIEGLNI